MSASTLTSPIEPILTGEQHIIFRHSSWATYQRLLTERQGTRPRFAYDLGTLEIMTTSLQHEKLVRLFEALINTLALAFDIDLESTGETTYQRADLARGFEPDGSYYITNPERVRGKEQLDLSIDPAPDLVVEIDLTSSSLNKQPIMAALGIKEVWHYQSGETSILKLSEEHYKIATDSDYFAGITSQHLSTWINTGLQTSRPQWLRQLQHEATILANAK